MGTISQTEISLQKLTRLLNSLQKKLQTCVSMCYDNKFLIVEACSLNNSTINILKL